MKIIKLTQGQITTVDDWNYDYLLKEGGWFAAWDKKSKRWDVRRMDGRKIILMHRFIMDAKNNEKVDHKDHDTLNNQEYNLRVCTHQQNSFNRKMNESNRSGFKGVYWHNKTGKYTGEIAIRIDGKRVRKSLGYSDDPVEIAMAYDIEAIKLFGEFAYLNFPN